MPSPTLFTLLCLFFMACGDTDADGDGFPSDEDCDDDDASVNPLGTEVCNGVDDDCDDSVDELASDRESWFTDADGDGWGDEASLVQACTAPAGLIPQSGDCDDGDPATSPDADEVCDGADNDCDGDTDEDAADSRTWYLDYDDDGFGTSAYTTQACEVPEGYADNSDDCDDSRASVYPGAWETCDGMDEDCDGTLDEDPQDPDPWYPDADGDGWGTGDATWACQSPGAGWAASDGDCNDADALFHPDASETDCADPADYNCDGSTGFADWDSDGHPACQDCDDSRADVNPGRPEVCNDIDDDCDADIDEEGALYAGTWYEDADEDGWGNPEVTLTSCDPPSGYLAYALDCDDTNADISPSAPELCNFKDDDCSGVADEDAIDASTWYQDGDGDGVGGTTETVACTPSAGWLASNDDCDDTDATVNPLAAETCDAIDNDCDGVINEGFDDFMVWLDLDEDGCGDASSGFLTCVSRASHVYNDDDCDDTNPMACEGFVETCDSADNDCDGDVDEEGSDGSWFWPDGDFDGYGDAGSTGHMACHGSEYYVPNGDDCDDDDDEVYPGRTEICDGNDNDCNGTVDDLPTAGWFYPDEDEDGFAADGASPTWLCAPTTGWAAAQGDCDDARADVNPGLEEACDDGVDNDCDALVDAWCRSETVCGPIDTATTWDVSTIYTITCSVNVRATLTVEAGTQVLFNKDTGITATAPLLVYGTEEHPVLFTSSSAIPTAGAWHGITASAGASGTVLDHAVVEYGGGNDYGGLYVASTVTATVTSSTLRANANTGILASGDVLIQDSTLSESVAGDGYPGLGVYVGSNGGLSPDGSKSFTGNTVTENESWPIRAQARVVGQLDDSSLYTGNGADQIFVDGAAYTCAFGVDATWQDLGVPYYIGYDLEICGASDPLLTLEPGVTLLFADTKWLYCGREDASGSGGIEAIGTETEPILFSSLTETTGAWSGINLRDTCSSFTLDHAEVAYGGHSSYAGIYIYNYPTGATISNTYVHHSAGYGIYDRTSTNCLFTNVTYSDNAKGNCYDW